MDARWVRENGYLALLGSVQFFTDRLARAEMAEPSAKIDTGEVQFYLLPWLVPGFRIEQVTVDRFPQGFPSRFQRYSVDVLALMGPNIILMAGPTWSEASGPDLPLFENLARVSLHLAF